LPDALLPRLLTPGPPVGVAEPEGASSGGQTVVHAVLHGTGWPPLVSV
jgi:hypothetical protein